MAAAQEDRPTFRSQSPSADTLPTPALGACPDLIRTLSTASSVSHGSATTDGSHLRESLGSDFSATSRHSSASFQSSSRRSDVSSASFLSRQSTGSLDNYRTSGGLLNRRRGYMRPQGTDFAASARSRESVLSLGSIAHLQYYFARTGLLDGKGAQLARKRALKGQTLDLSALDTNFLTPKIVGSDVDSAYAPSMAPSSPDLLATHSFSGAGMVESPIEEEHGHNSEHPDDEYYFDDFEEPDPHMLPPTASTYNFREKPLPKPPSIVELKADLTIALDNAAQALDEAKENKHKSPPETPTIRHPDSEDRPQESSPGWHEVQGMHILDVMTLAIRAAKVYYTAHEQPDRLDAIKSERALRSELLGVMDVLKRMASRAFAGGLRDEEHRTMADWIAGLRSMLAAEEAMEAADAAQRAAWTWLRDADWAGRPPHERELAFLRSMWEATSDVTGEGPIPDWTPVDRTAFAAATAAAADGAAEPQSPQVVVPTPFLASMQSGLRLVQLHNAAVRRSVRRFGAIPTFHTDTQKPYRAADNLRYWLKAAELRWEVLLRVDALAVVYNNSPAAWLDFEDAILRWCRTVREELASELLRA